MYWVAVRVLRLRAHKGLIYYVPGRVKDSKLLQVKELAKRMYWVMYWGKSISEQCKSFVFMGRGAVCALNGALRGAPTEQWAMGL